MTIISNESLAEFIDRAGLLAAVVADFRTELKARILAGQDGCGYKVVRGPAHRKWIASDSELAKKFKNMKLKETDYFIKKLRGPATMEKCDKFSDRQKEKLKNLWIKPEGALILKPESAAGTPIVHESGAAFTQALAATDETLTEETRKPFSFI